MEDKEGGVANFFKLEQVLGREQQNCSIGLLTMRTYAEVWKEDLLSTFSCSTAAYKEGGANKEPWIPFPFPPPASNSLI